MGSRIHVLKQHWRLLLPSTSTLQASGWTANAGPGWAQGKIKIPLLPGNLNQRGQTPVLLQVRGRKLPVPSLGPSEDSPLRSQIDTNC